MKNIKANILSLNLKLDNVELDVDFDILQQSNEPAVLKVKYHNKYYLALFNELDKSIIVFDNEEIKE